jgi:NADPH:quinone reductase
MKPMKYKRIVVTKRGPPENLQITECDLRDPLAKEVRVKVLATCVCLPDVQARYGLSPFAPKLPFVPGYTIVGVVDAVGPGVTQAAPGTKVAAYLIIGGYAEYIYLRENQLIPVPPSVNPAEAVPLLLNYVTAYQALHRSAKVKAGDKVLFIGASGGCGTAFLDLGRLANLKMYGIASKSKHPIVAEYGATPIDYRTEDFVEVIRRAEPGGLDAIFDGMGGRLHRKVLPAAASRRRARGVRQSSERARDVAHSCKNACAPLAAERQEGQALRGRGRAVQPKAVSGGLGYPLSAARGGQDSAGHQR